jgi:hypothetical protein
LTFWVSVFTVGNPKFGAHRQLFNLDLVAS